MSKIEWTDETWNPVLGCSRVSPGCDVCYAIPQANMRAKNPNPKIAKAFEGLTTRRDDRLDWTGRVNLLPERLDEPLRWRTPRRIFVNSMADLFDGNIPAEFIARIFAVMAVTPRHTYQVLTKRHGRLRALLNSTEFRHQVYEHAWDIDPDGRFDPYRHAPDHMIAADYERPNYPGDDSDWWPLPNVWVGVSVEDQTRAELRIPALLATPAAVRWLSCEPLLGPVDLSRWLDVEHMDALETYGEESGAALTGQVGPAGGLHWVVVGGESGSGARPMHPDWVRILRDQCAAAGTAFFFKQHGAWVPESAWLHRDSAPAAFLDVDGRFRPLVKGKPATAPMARGEAITIRQVGKKTAGRELDGRTWDEFPSTDGKVVAR